MVHYKLKYSEKEREERRMKFVKGKELALFKPHKIGRAIFAQELNISKFMISAYSDGSTVVPDEVLYNIQALVKRLKENE